MCLQCFWDKTIGCTNMQMFTLGEVLVQPPFKPPKAIWDNTDIGVPIRHASKRRKMAKTQTKRSTTQVEVWGEITHPEMQDDNTIKFRDTSGITHHRAFALRGLLRWVDIFTGTPTAISSVGALEAACDNATATLQAKYHAHCLDVRSPSQREFEEIHTHLCNGAFTEEIKLLGVREASVQHHLLLWFLACNTHKRKVLEHFKTYVGDNTVEMLDLSGDDLEDLGLDL